MNISVIIPVYNRPGEMAEILHNLAEQHDADFEVIVVEDGSDDRCSDVVKSYEGRVRLRYFEQPNSGPALARNLGAERASGDFFVFLDSDVILPPEYIETVREAVASGVEFYGGPDAAMNSFTPLQRAINYSMTSIFTTGGIRGSMKKRENFKPRSFNMGVSRRVFEKAGGFNDMRFGEDIDFSMRVINLGTRATLLREAKVYHKRRTNIGAFARQVYFSGVARVNISMRHPRKKGDFLYLLPAIFVLGVLGCIILAPFTNFISILLLLLTLLIWFGDSLFRNRSPVVALLSAVTSFVMLCGYGTGFLSCLIRRHILRSTEAETFRTNFR